MTGPDPRGVSGANASEWSSGEERSDDPRDGAERGQTLPDFTVGIAVFLLAVAFVVAFVPQLVLPFEDQEQSVVVERVAGDLGNDLLAAKDAPSKLDEGCTLAFFGHGGGEDCSFDPDDPIADRLGIRSTYSVNVTLRDAPSDGPSSNVLCAEDGSIDDCGGTDRLAVGPTVPRDDGSVATARRAVFGDETGAVLEVRVW